MSVELFEALTTTRSIHRYTDDPVPEADLAKILHAATRGPSGSNAQPFRFLVLRDGERSRQAKALLGESFRAAWRAKSDSEGWEKGSGTDPDSRKARSARAMQQFVDDFERIPVVILACHVRERPRNLFDGASIYPSCQNLLLAARGLGYGSCIAMFHTAAEPALRELLEIPDEAVIYATMPLGVPQGRHGPLRRRPARELVYDETWGNQADWATDPPGSRFSRGGRPTPER